MEESSAIRALSALAQDTRLAVFRMLVGAGTAGLAAGEIARRLGVPANTISTHLGLLARSGLIAPRREGRSVFYAAEFDGVRALLSYLLQHCCGGRPELCAPLLEAALPAAACPGRAMGDRRQ